MTDFDWTAKPTRPLTDADVWALMVHGCNAAEIAEAGGVCPIAALAMMRAAASGPKRETLRLKAA